MHIFNGVNAKLAKGQVLIDKGIIKNVSSGNIDAPPDTLVIDGGNRILSPGFIDLHAYLASHSPLEERRSHPSVAGAYAVNIACLYLDHGFTTIRDAGGTHPDLARAFNSGNIDGPRVYPSGAYISQTGGMVMSGCPTSRIRY